MKVWRKTDHQVSGFVVDRCLSSRDLAVVHFIISVNIRACV